METILKVIVKDGCEQDFEKYCKENNIFCKVYPIEILKTRYRAECTFEQLKNAEMFIISIEHMPMMSIS